MGYYDYQQGLIRHHMDQEGGWDSHLEHCRNFILKAIEIIKPDTVTVLGSGWLLDLPLAEMTETVEKINLVDIIHPPEVISQVSGLDKVKLIEQDITGGLIKETWMAAHRHTFLNPLESLDEISVTEYQPVDDPGLIISVNILTQLESLPVKLLKGKMKADDAGFLNFRKEIQKKHIDFLKKHKSVLITDQSEIVTDNAGNMTEDISLLTELPDGTYKEEWTWYFEMQRSDYYNKRSVFNVVGLIF